MKLTQIANSRKFQSFLRVATFGIVIPVMALEFTLVMFTVRGHQLYSEEKYQEAETFYRLAIPFNLISDHPYRRSLFSKNCWNATQRTVILTQL
jgi:hypothetical protein